jgi:hypothetical protein
LIQPKPAFNLLAFGRVPKAGFETLVFLAFGAKPETKSAHLYNPPSQATTRVWQPKQ